MAENKLHQQIAFILEIDKLKSVFRRTRIADDSRYENDAEHSWHFAVMAVILQEYSGKADILKVLKMALIHDIVEIDAGDTFLYQDDLQAEKCQKENNAARRIFGLLPAEQREEMITLWREFEARQTTEAKFAAALDRLGPVLLNYQTRGRAWRENDVPAHKVLAVNSRIGEGSAELWEYAKGLIEDAISKGYIK